MAGFFLMKCFFLFALGSYLRPLPSLFHNCAFSQHTIILAMFATILFYCDDAFCSLSITAWLCGYIRADDEVFEM